jgi:hypothetical protein
MSEMVPESRSSVEIAQTAKGDPVVKVKVYAATVDLDAVDAAAAKAIELYRSTCQEVGA